MEFFSPFTNLEFWGKLLRKVAWSQALTPEKYEQSVDFFINLNPPLIYHTAYWF